MISLGRYKPTQVKDQVRCAGVYHRSGPPHERLAEPTPPIFWGLKGPDNGQASHGPRRAVRDSLGSGRALRGSTTRADRSTEVSEIIVDTVAASSAGANSPIINVATHAGGVGINIHLHREVVEIRSDPKTEAVAPLVQINAVRYGGTRSYVDRTAEKWILPQAQLSSSAWIGRHGGCPGGDQRCR